MSCEICGRRSCRKSFHSLEMFTKKIIIKNEQHFIKVVKALGSIGDNIYSDEFFLSLRIIAFNNNENKWYRFDNYYEDYFKNVPEFEIVTKTSYELKEVPKFKIACKSCGEIQELKDLAIFKSQIDFGNQVITYLEDKIICKDCVVKLINDK